jgi:isopenicillin N synthase-like dioxygenase
MLKEASNGYFTETTHRVNNPGVGIESTSRISIPLFLTPRLDVVLILALFAVTQRVRLNKHDVAEHQVIRGAAKRVTAVIDTIFNPDFGLAVVAAFALLQGQLVQPFREI